MRWIRLPTLLFLITLPGAVPAPAQKAAPGGDDPVKEALARFDAGDLAGAIALLEPFRGREGVEPRVLANLGALYVEAGRPSDALAVLEPLALPPDANPAVLYNAGRAALALGRTEESESFLRRSVEAFPRSPAVRELGLLEARSGRCVDGLLHLRSWVGNAPDDVEVRVAAAFCAVQLERVPDAEEMLSDLPQDNPRVRLLWGKLLMLKGDPYGAIATLKPLLEGGPSHLALEVRRGLAEAHTAVGQGAEAVELLEGRVGDEPSVALQLAAAQYKSGDLEAALETLEPFAQPLLSSDSGTTQGASSAEIALEYGRLLVTAGRHAEALPFLELATQGLPENKLGWQALGQALAAVGRTEEAKAALERFREITHSEVPVSVQERQLERDVGDPTGREVREALRLLGQGRPEEALAIVRREAELSPEDPRPRLLEARIVLELGRAEESLEIADAVATAHPQNADAHYQRGVSLMAVQRLGPAEEALRRSLELQPEHTPAMNDLAVLLMEKGEQSEARRLLERVLELRPDDPAATANLEFLENEADGSS